MKIIEVNDCNNCPHYRNESYGRFTCFETGITVSKKGVDKTKAIKLLMNNCPLKEVERIIYSMKHINADCKINVMEDEGCINCEFADINNCSDTCNHKKADEYSSDGFGSIPNRYSRPDWCPLKVVKE